MEEDKKEEVHMYWCTTDKSLWDNFVESKVFENNQVKMNPMEVQITELKNVSIYDVLKEKAKQALYSYILFKGEPPLIPILVNMTSMDIPILGGYPGHFLDALTRFKIDYPEDHEMILTSYWAYIKDNDVYIESESDKFTMGEWQYRYPSNTTEIFYHCAIHNVNDDKEITQPTLILAEDTVHKKAFAKIVETYRKSLKDDDKSD